MAFFERFREFFLWLAEREKLPRVESKEDSRIADRMRSILKFIALPEELPEKPAPVKFGRTRNRHPALSFLKWIALPEVLSTAREPVNRDQPPKPHPGVSWLAASETLPKLRDLPHEKRPAEPFLRWLFAREPLESTLDTHSTNEESEDC